MGRDCAASACGRGWRNFNPRAPYGARPKAVKHSSVHSVISIHAPRMGRDKSIAAVGGRAPLFQSTRPVWGATPIEMYIKGGTDISIHAPRMGRDVITLLSSFFVLSFQSTRPVWGATACPCPCAFLTTRFQSTRPVWGATVELAAATAAYFISIHAPRMGRDIIADQETIELLEISIHAPRMGRDCRGAGAARRTSHFNPRAPYGARPRMRDFS